MVTRRSESLIAEAPAFIVTKAARQGKGLGLTSMRERVRLINGTIAIDSKPMSGTTIHVRVPLGMHPSKQVAV